VVQQLVVIWQAVFRRVYAHYDLAAESYFRHLQLGGQGSCSRPGTISATLRLLHLAVTHPLELHEVFQAGLAATPAGQWIGIIPQLFSRLNHPVPIVKQRISDLLCRLSDTFPHLIIFPAVVGGLAAGSQAAQALTALLGSSDSSQPALSQEEETGPAGGTEMAGAHNRIVEVLRRRSPAAIEQVTVLVGELRRITLLWDELWLGTLLQHGGEVARQVKRFQEEADRLAANTTLTGEERDTLLVDKYSIVFRRLLHLLDQVAAITRAPPETPHEEQFQRRHGRAIDSLLERVRQPADWSRPTEAWAGLQQLQQQLQLRAHGKRGASLRLAEISPLLVGLRDTAIAMPGHQGDGGLVTVRGFDGGITILPTKTKPKKLSMMGDDGTKYTYLFKGLEDLHLDERIMQFLAVANQMMVGGREGGYTARHYSVVPLGPRSGLIQWVGGAVPLFSLYKRWQARQQGHLEAAKRTEEAAKVVMKPSDQFYSKMLPLLRKQGVTKLDDRKSWPVPLLKQVLAELTAETPACLLAQELWLGAASSAQWWRLTQAITRSFAVMSIIGYILGLGDRHLDNVLVDLASGEVVHIDYNISFEKGKNLRIPERVPCRLTQNIVSAFGVSGVEGLFRQSCEHTLRVLRRGRDTLLTLLEAFVYDPLVDWTPGLVGGLAGAMYGGQGEGHGQEGRQEMESTLTFSMLGVRVAEMKGAWVENQHDLAAGLMQVRWKGRIF
jgi:PI-3-kinase-related kinase SMG-1